MYYSTTLHYRCVISRCVIARCVIARCAGGSPVGHSVECLQELQVALLVLKVTLVGQDVQVLLVPAHVHQDAVLVWGSEVRGQED